MVKELKKGGVTLCTDSYSHSEIENLREALESKFNFLDKATSSTKRVKCWKPLTAASN